MRIKNFLYVTLLLLITSAAWAQMSKSLQFREESFDFGQIAEAEGPVTHEFTFTNNTSRPVKILAVKASCGCTTPDWSKEPVPPGKTGFVQARYNPQGRPGYFNKSLTVTTDFDANPIMLQIKGQVNSDVAAKHAVEFQASNGNWKLRTNSFNMGRTYLKDEFVSKTFQVWNSGEKIITYTGKYDAPAYITVEVEPKVLDAGAIGTVTIGYNGKLKNAYGFQSDNVTIYTDDAVNPAKSFNVYATLEDFFPAMSPEELAKAPQLLLPTTAFDLGRIKQNQPAIQEVTLQNTGKEELLLKSLQENCTCIKATSDKTKLKPGESTTLKISFNPQERLGTQTKAVTIFSNDPKHPVQRVMLTAYVED